jgi:hypothetical protein
MARSLWCRHAGCGFGLTLAADVGPPTTCPVSLGGCGKVAAWTEVRPDGGRELEAASPFALSYEDKRFLRKLRIATWDDEPQTV